MKFLILLLVTSVAHAALPSKEFQFQKSLQTVIKNSTMPDVYPGMVVASPSKSEPNYYYDWVRDTALTMRTLVDYWEISKDPKIKKMILTWIDSETNRQNRPSRSGLGEPKYNIDGSGFMGDWCRPQNDGPALRAIAMIKFARLLIDGGERDFVSRKIYFGVLPANTPLKKDLEYTAHHWREKNCEPWEESWGQHFYNLLAGHTALQEGAALAQELGDGGAAAFYREKAREIGTFIQANFFDDKIGIRVSIETSGMDYKNSGLDVSPLLALNHTWPYQKLISLNHPNVKKYVATLIEKNKEIYKINTLFPNLGVAIGRYPEDQYDGYRTDRLGNPWFLSTLALGEHYCLSGQKGNLVEKQFQRVLFHSDRKGRLAEQFNRDTGVMQGARELTWSHGAFMTAMMRCRLVKKQL